MFKPFRSSHVNSVLNFWTLRLTLAISFGSMRELELQCSKLRRSCLAVCFGAMRTPYRGINLRNFEKVRPVFVGGMAICIVCALERDRVRCMTNFELAVALEPTLHRTLLYVVSHSAHGRFPLRRPLPQKIPLAKHKQSRLCDSRGCNCKI
jgi:hypothetical protein